MRDNTARFRDAMADVGFELIDGRHPLVPVVIGSSVATQRVADGLYRAGIYAAGHCHRIVQEGRARYHVESAGGQRTDEWERTAAAIGSVGGKLDLV